MSTPEKEIKAGDLMAYIQWVKVTKAPRNVRKSRTMTVDEVGSKDGKFEIIGTGLIEQGESADYYGSEKTVTMTEAAEMLVSAHNRPFTVVFDRANGTERTLRGRLRHAEPLLGRSSVDDLDVESGSPIRLVDHRTIKSLILGGVKYNVKKK